jgi:hypothetical protein
MDAELRKELRAWKVEVEDRIRALEATVASQSATSDVAASDSGKSKKAVPEAPAGESA